MRNRVAVDVQIIGEQPHTWQSLSVLELTHLDHERQLCHYLPIDRKIRVLTHLDTRDVWNASLRV